jgi:hypothetical protein
MDKSGLFSYLSAFVTIVLAVAITDMIQSTHRLIRGRERVKWDVVPLVFAGVVAANVVSEFFSLWDLFDVSKISFARLLWILLIPTLLALLAYSALPDEVPAEGLDLRLFYRAERKSWIIIYGPPASSTSCAASISSTNSAPAPIIPNGSRNMPPISRHPCS